MQFKQRHATTPTPFVIKKLVDLKTAGERD
jgi:hypothetical protein